MGLRNYKYFFLFVAYACVACLLEGGVLALTALDIGVDPNASPALLAGWAGVACGAGLVMLIGVQFTSELRQYGWLLRQGKKAPRKVDDILQYGEETKLRRLQRKQIMEEMENRRHVE